ncbi:hypothetical protein M0802_003971 [Mischocyttarus mexicanus]|nr:hypothetical protein M0802_003971 [Mischocyttarus mexicanus]
MTQKTIGKMVRRGKKASKRGCIRISNLGSMVLQRGRGFVLFHRTIFIRMEEVRIQQSGWLKKQYPDERRRLGYAAVEVTAISPSMPISMVFT